MKVPTLRAMLAVGVCLTSFVIPSTVEADDLLCHGRLGHIRVAGVHVPSGATCVLEGTLVQGDVRVRRGGTLLASGATIRGNIDSDGAVRIQLLASKVHGSTTLMRSADAVVVGDCTDPNRGRGTAVVIDGNIQLRGNYAWSGVCGAIIRGNLQASRNSGVVHVAGNAIGGNLSASENFNSLSITFNAIKGNLRCEQNDIPPLAHSNRVGGNREGECAVP